MGRHVSMSPRDPGPPGTIYWAGQQSAGVRVVISLHTDDLHTAVRRAAVLVDAIEREGAHARTWTDHDAFLKALESAGIGGPAYRPAGSEAKRFMTGP
jgi:hypothetical protein